MIRRLLVRLAAVLGAAACTAHTGPGAPGWEVTVYYTAVESFHHGPAEAVTGCPVYECSNGTDRLGVYPADFVSVVHDEGAGRITSGPHAGRYLNWSAGSGYWLDTAPRDTNGRPLVPFVSAAADGLRNGTHVRLTGCGRQDDGSPVPPSVCHRLSSPVWQIRDAFTPGLGGPHHIDLYIGAETGPGFTAQPIYVTLVGATITTS